MHHAGGESTRAHKNSDVGGFYRGTHACGTPTRCRYPLQEVTAPPLAGLGAVIMRDFTVRDCRRSQGAKDRSGACARIANLQADAQHIEREMAQLRTELEQALRPWWRRLVGGGDGRLSVYVTVAPVCAGSRPMPSPQQSQR